MRLRWILAIGGGMVLLSILGIAWQLYGLERTNWFSAGIVAVALAYAALMVPLLRKEKPSEAPVALELGRRDQVSERFNEATNRLGSETIDVRIGAIYALEQIASDSPNLHWPVMEILTAFVREHAKLDTAPEPPDRERASSDLTIASDERLAAINETGPTLSRGREPSRRPPGDIQAALRVLGRRNPARDVGNLDLNRANLCGAILREANLNNVNFRWANLREANLMYATMDRATLQGADLRGASLDRANLKHSDMREANLSRAILVGTDLSGADLSSANLELASMLGAELQEAVFIGARLVQANLARANLRGASLYGARLSGAVFTYETYDTYDARELTWDQLSTSMGVEQAYLPTYLKQRSAESS